jgi:hypothetical protein
MGFRTLWDEVIHLNSTPFEGGAKKSGSGTEIECDFVLSRHYLKKNEMGYIRD